MSKRNKTEPAAARWLPTQGRGLPVGTAMWSPAAHEVAQPANAHRAQGSVVNSQNRPFYAAAAQRAARFANNFAQNPANWPFLTDVVAGLSPGPVLTYGNAIGAAIGKAAELIYYEFKKAK